MEAPKTQLKQQGAFMKQLLLPLILMSASVAWGSKARLISLQGADHIVDNQTIFRNPAHLNLLGQYITFEMGTPGTNAEGGFARTLNGGGKLSAYVGSRNSTPTFAFGDIRLANGYVGQNNPLEVTYAANNMGFAGSVSTIDDKATGIKETSVIGKFGMLMGEAEFYTHLYLISQAQQAAGANTDKISAPRAVVGGAMNSGDLRFYGSALYGQAKNEIGATSTSTTIKDMGLMVGFEDRSMKTADNDIYYGAQVQYVNRDIGGTKITGTQLPVFLGMEMPVTEWATFRGSVSQNLLVGSIKDETAAVTDPSGINNNATVTAGLGLKYKKLVIDGALAAATSGNVNGTSFLTTASATYNF